jgi:hypothetical protein
MIGVGSYAVVVQAEEPRTYRLHLSRDSVRRKRGSLCFGSQPRDFQLVCFAR